MQPEPTAEDPISDLDFETWKRTARPPANEVPIIVALNAPLLRSDEAALTLTHGNVYSRGVVLRIVAAFRPDEDGGQDLDEAELERFVAEPVRMAAVVMPDPSSEPDFEAVITMADGTVLRAPMADTTDGGYHVSHWPLSAGDSSFATNVWLTPLPPDGSLRLGVASPTLNIAADEASAVIDATALREAANSILPLWE